MKLHCSQTCASSNPQLIRLSSLWNYTALKQGDDDVFGESVWVPYEITLLSNSSASKLALFNVWVPYEITLLSNKTVPPTLFFAVWVPYEITLLSNTLR